MNAIDLLDEKLLDHATGSGILTVEEYQEFQYRKNTKQQLLQHLDGVRVVEDIAAVVWTRCIRGNFDQYIEWLKKLGLNRLANQLSTEK